MGVGGGGHWFVGIQYHQQAYYESKQQNKITALETLSTLCTGSAPRTSKHVREEIFLESSSNLIFPFTTYCTY